MDDSCSPNIKGLPDCCETPLEDLDLEELRARWERDTKIISEIVQLENELGRPLTMLDLLCRFDEWEIDCVSGMLRWLVVEEAYV
jgi:hypothetical protein